MKKYTNGAFTCSLVLTLLFVMLAPLASASAPTAQPVIEPSLFSSHFAGAPVPLRPSSFPVVAQGLNNPRGMTFGPDGGLYIAEAGVGGPTCFTFPDGSQVCWGYTSQVTRVLNGQQTVLGPGLISLSTPTGEAAEFPMFLVRGRKPAAPTRSPDPN